MSNFARNRKDITDGNGDGDKNETWAINGYVKVYANILYLDEAE
jgi:hypothetical protein